MKGLLLWIAQGFGIGRIPAAPGTFGSILGLLWTALLLRTGQAWGFFGGAIAGLACSVWFTDRAEKILGRTDPSSVVLDEIAAMPVCFFAWVAAVLSATGSMPGPEHFVSRQTWWLTLAIFVAFRLFDIWKPWPVRQSQKLPGGWGVTIDDVLAAVYVNGLAIVAYMAARLGDKI